ncbi:alpha-glucan family phosphorylase [Spirosoma sp. BT702]|uniref:Alpha-glucan family phosphorylase n=1 Tax=Spirosoma profusum TaxID=2771354 RepID=A0A927AT79_9BACT|nr:alpha-glucan family phosphorylase [Spirosoma profusum]MBD2702825.1 alpha-glucan family phosphorylase [Spirosoma profusum]
MISQLPSQFPAPYTIDDRFKTSVAYFSMEIAVDQALKTYSGGLGFLAGSHMRSAYELKQNLIGISMLWKYGYYDQVRKTDNSMDVQFREKIYSFLQDTGIEFTVDVYQTPVRVKAYYLEPNTFQSVPLFFLTTDVDGNDSNTRAISYRLYDNDVRMKIAQCMILGIGGAKLIDALGASPDVYHLNEAHALSAAFYLYQKAGTIKKVRQRLVFTTHTPEEAGNEKHDINLLQEMGFFGGLSLDTVRELTGMQDNVFNHSLAALRLSRHANGVSKLHGEVARQMWGRFDGICPITHVTNAQNQRYWTDSEIEKARVSEDGQAVAARKIELKKPLFRLVADQVGKLFDPNVLTLVWARRFATYKRPDLLSQDIKRFSQLLSQTDYPVQIIWAGKPYPLDYGSVHVFNQLYYLSHLYPNMAVVTGYELGLSKLLKDGADGWLNTPIVNREASGTSGMTAAMNGAVNISTNDGWVREFARPGENSFLVPTADPLLPDHARDEHDRDGLFDLLENEILPMYYNRPADWQALVLRSMNDVNSFFGANRMASEYYEKMY